MKKVIVPLSIIFILICLGGVFLYYNNNKKELEEKEKIEEIRKNYGPFIKTTRETKLLKLENDQYIEHGVIGSNNEFELSSEKINFNTQYFNIKNTNYYVSYKDVTPIKELKSHSQRYKSYIPFNENIITNKKTTLSDEDGNFITYNESFNLPIIIKEEDKYGISFNDRLYYINKSDVKEITNNINSTDKPKEKITTLTYHFIYDPNIEKCNQIICHKLEQFESHLKYLKENNYLTLRLNELEMFLDGKINIPENSVVLTIDDGTMLNTEALRLLEKYEEYATLFVITSWVTDLESLSSPYLDLESHTHNLHNQYECKMGLQGGGLLCRDEEYLHNDLTTSQEKLGGSKYLSYPFFDVNDHAIKALKDAGFTMAFIGQSNTNGKSWRGTNKYKVPRKTISSITTLKEFISYIN